MSNLRNVTKILSGIETSDGAGVSLRRYIASPQLDMLDPFLLLDMFSSDNPDDYIAASRRIHIADLKPSPIYCMAVCDTKIAQAMRA
jgi:redox-sensitive bicupin YhaK (pirin superfamily)